MPPKRRLPRGRSTAPKLTVLAEKYGTLNLPSYPTEGTGKSGVTPLTAGPFASQDEKDVFAASEYLQITRFHGFTSAELHAIECFAPWSTIDEPFLLPQDSPIHPIFALENWDPPLLSHLARYPLGNGRLGYWEAKNPLVTPTWTSVVQLASFIIGNAHMFGWWDALFFGTFEDVDVLELPTRFANRKFATFRRRDRAECMTETAQQKLQTQFLQAADVIEWCLHSGRTEIDSGIPHATGGGAYGTTSEPVLLQPKIRIHITYELFEPLMTMQLNKAERALDTFRAASTIVHELAHAIWLIRRPKLATKYRTEPFFELERTAELGFSAENVMFGGCVSDLMGASQHILGRDCMPAAAIRSSSWDTVWYCEYSKGSPNLIPPHPSYYSREDWPIPVEWFFKIQDQGFWDVWAKKFGPKAIHMGPKVVGYRRSVPNTTVTKPDLNDKTLKVGRSKHWAAPEGPYLPWDAAKTPENIAIMNEENARRRKTDSLQDALERRVQDVRNAVVGTGPAWPPPAILPRIIPVIPEPPRYLEIKNHLLNCWYELAIDTMDFNMPEHTMFNYILAEGGLQITFSEWREFLEYSQQTNVLFMYTRIGASTGVLRKIDRGWPPVAVRTRPRPNFFTRPSARSMRMFRRLCLDVIDKWACFEDGFKDHDWNDFYQRLNIRYSYENDRMLLKDAFRRPIRKINRRMFDALVYQSYRTNFMITYGPRNCLRLMTPPSNARERLRPQGDPCPTM